MVAQVETPNLIPVPPEWLRKQSEQKAANANRNINDIYWRKPDGWIVVGPSAVPGADGRPLTRQAESLIRRGWEPLIEYSYTSRISPVTGQRDTIETTADRLNTPDRYYWLFANGGAHLFRIEQIVEHHWHVEPPYGLPKSVFPQLDEWEVPEPRWCPLCVGRAPMNSEDQVVKHLILVHKPMTNQAATDRLQFATKPPVGAGGVAIRRKVNEAHKQAEIDIATAQAEGAPKTRVCNQCGAAITGKLADHKC
jgi:hypothetical protein